MINGTTSDRYRNATRRAPFVLAIILISASGSASAQWFEKLKNVFGGDEGEEQPLSSNDIGGGLKEALRVGTENVVGSLGQTDGFNLDPQIHIPLPRQLSKVKNVLEKVGMDSMLADLELRLNRAAEIATPKAKEIFFGAINDMTLDDVMTIYNGPDDAATQYFKSKMSAPLAIEMKPVVDASLEDAGAVKSYDTVMGSYNDIPFVPKVNADLSDYVVQKGMDGIFHYLAVEEAAIREDPAKRTTDILQRVFKK